MAEHSKRGKKTMTTPAQPGRFHRRRHTQERRLNLKKLTLVAAVTAASGTPAFAQPTAPTLPEREQSTPRPAQAAPRVVLPSATGLQLYGRLYPYVLEERGSGATAPGTPLATIASTATPTGVNALGRRWGMEAGNSRLGFRGVEDLGGGLKARFQLEGTVDVDGGGGYRFNRDTFVGLEGGFGAVRLGNLDTIFKDYGDTIGILGLSSGTFLSGSNILRKPGFGTNNASRFHERRPNSIQYETPIVGGFRFGAHYATEEALSNQPVDPRTLSLGVKYDQGPIYVALAHEIHRDYFGGSRNVRTALRNNDQTADSRDRATQFTIEYRINRQHKVEFDVIRKHYSETGGAAGRFAGYENTAYMFAWENRWTDKFRTAGHIIRSNAGNCSLRGGAACSTDGLEGAKFALAARYDLSRRTGVFVAASYVRNGKSAQYGSREFANNPNPGEDIRHLAAGVVHSF